MSRIAERLARAKNTLPTRVHHLRVEDDTQARAQLETALNSGDQTLIDEAKAVLAACYEELVLTALAPEDMEKLRGQHPPTPEQQERRLLFNRATFLPALVHASCPESGISVDEWVEYTTKGPLRPGEVNDLFNACWDLNYPFPDAWLGKDSTSTSS